MYLGVEMDFYAKRRERRAEPRLEVSHTGLQNLPQGHFGFLQIFY